MDVLFCGVIVLFGVFLCKCNYPNNGSRYNESLLGLSLMDQKTFNLDSLSLPNSKCFQYYKIKEKRYLTFTNHQLKRIYFYDYETENLKFSWSTPDTILNSVAIDGHYIHNHDSIYLFSYHNASLFLFNMNGDYLDRYNLTRDKSSTIHPPTPVIGTFNPVIITDTAIFCSGYIVGEYLEEDLLERPVMIEYNIDTQKLKYYTDYPSLYAKDNWGGIDFRKVFMTRNANKIILSFPASNSFTCFDLNDNSSIPVKMSNKPFKIRPLSRRKEYNSKFKEEPYYHFFSSYSYGPVLYDKYQNIFYRFIYYPAKSSKKRDHKTWSRDWAIELIDTCFQVIGKKEFNVKRYQVGEAFVTEEGLNVVVNRIGENKICFNIYEIYEL